ncbi:MAG TPA: SDR family oxidoreductase [Roseiarcus sp.]
MTIAVTGATGQLGRLVVDKLKAKTGEAIVALVRSPANARGLGVAVREADYAKPATLEAALAGVDVLLFISSSEIRERAAQHHNVIEAAKAAEVKRIVYTSLLHADVSPMSLGVEHRATEAQLKASGIPHAILRNGWYTENHAASIDGALAGGAVIGSAANGKFSCATRADYAEAAVTALAGTGHDGKTYELAGDHAYTLSDFAAEVSRQTGRIIPYRNLPIAEYATALAGFGLPEAIAKAVAGWDADAADGALFDNSRQLSALIGRPTTPLSTTVAEALGAVSKA